MTVIFKTIAIPATNCTFCSVALACRTLKQAFALVFSHFSRFRARANGNIEYSLGSTFCFYQSCIVVTCENRMQLVEEELLLNSFHYIFFLFFFFPFRIFGTLDFLIRTTYFSFKLNIAVPSQLSVNKTSRTKKFLKRFCTIFFTMFLILHLFNHTSSYPMHNT